MIQRRIELSMCRARQKSTPPAATSTSKKAPRTANHFRETLRASVISTLSQRWPVHALREKLYKADVGHRQEAWPRSDEGHPTVGGLFLREIYFGGKISGWLGLPADAATLNAASSVRVTGG